MNIKNNSNNKGWGYVDVFKYVALGSNKINKMAVEKNGKTTGKLELSSGENNPWGKTRVIPKFIHKPAQGKTTKSTYYPQLIHSMSHTKGVL